MMDPDTKMGGGRSAFPDTQLSAVRAAAADKTADRTRAHERLIAAYWKPVYKYIRIKFGTPNEEAKDLTQGFFTRAIEKKFFSGYDPKKGTFRTYLRMCVDRFLANERQYSLRQKRSGDLGALPLDFEAAESELRLGGAPAMESFEAYFDQEWTRSMFGLALETLRRDCERCGNQIQMRLFECYDLEENPGNLTYAELGAEFGISASAVTNHLAGARRAFRRIVLETLRDLTASEREFRSEARSLGIEV